MVFQDLSVKVNSVIQSFNHTSLADSSMLKFIKSSISSARPLLYQLAFPLGDIKSNDIGFDNMMAKFSCLTAFVIVLVIVAVLDAIILNNKRCYRKRLSKLFILPFIVFILQYMFYFNLPLQGTTFFQMSLSFPVSMYSIFLVQSLVMALFCIYSFHKITGSLIISLLMLVEKIGEFYIFNSILNAQDVSDIFRYFHMFMLFQSIIFFLVYCFALCFSDNLSETNDADHNGYNLGETGSSNQSIDKENFSEQKKYSNPSPKLYAEKAQKDSNNDYSPLFPNLSKVYSSSNQKYTIPEKAINKNKDILPLKKNPTVQAEAYPLGNNINVAYFNPFNPNLDFIDLIEINSLPNILYDENITNSKTIFIGPNSEMTLQKRSSNNRSEFTSEYKNYSLFSNDY